MPCEAESAHFDVAGMGNAIVDVIAYADDDFLDKFDIVKGSMNLIETDRALELYQALDTPVEMSGGSAANTMCGVASFGGRAAYIGKVADDDLGDVFGHDLRAVGVRFRPGSNDADLPTARSIIVVTPDAERTMNTYLGASNLLGPDDVDVDTVAASRVLYLEGYLYDRSEAKEAFGLAAEVAHRNGRQVALSLSDSFCVQRHRDDFVSLLEDHVDIVFGNEDELAALYGIDEIDACVGRAERHCGIVVATRGASGSMISVRGERVVVDASPVAEVLDSTGAGDMYAAGFLYGYTAGVDIAQAGRYGSMAAAEVIGHVGPRPLVELRTLLT